MIVSGTMLVFGGNTHNDTSMSHGAKCFSSDFMAYDIGKFPKDVLALGVFSLPMNNIED